MPPAVQVQKLTQNLIDTHEQQTLRYLTVADSALGEPSGLKAIAPFETYPSPLGVSPGFSADFSRLTALAISNGTKCLVVEFTGKSKAAVAGRKILETRILCRELSDLFVFDCAPVVLYLHHDFDLRMMHAVNIQSAFPPAQTPLACVQTLVGDDYQVLDANINAVFQELLYDPQESSRGHALDIVQRAWLSHFVATVHTATSTFDAIPRINSKAIPELILNTLAKDERDARRRNHLKPTSVQHEFRHATSPNDGVVTHKVSAKSTNFKNRIRRSTDVEMTVSTAHGSYIIPGRTSSVNGQMAELTPSQGVNAQHITALHRVGPESLTVAEKNRQKHILQVLQGKSTSFTKNPWIHNIFLSPDSMTWPESWCSSQSPALSGPDRNLHQLPLNDSQRDAVRTMLSVSPHHRILLIQGPPGTGKTSVIANFVKIATQNHLRGIWLIAHSNVAVKNIAEKLTSYKFLNYRLLVSEDFKHEWHDHLYNKITDNIITSDEFKKYPVSKLRDCQVILCTLSMLSNFYLSSFTTSIPIQTLVVDEASQIEIGDYTHLFPKLVNLRKLCFIGDNKQLPPFGNDNLKDLKSIFELDHLLSGTLFLNTQYRMPPYIGGFISKHVYDSRLQSNSLHPISNTIQSCYFIDVDGHEQYSNQSFKNLQECEVVLKLAQHFQDLGKSYRIITPYEAQTFSIESGMKSRELEWDDKCFNIDGFQGNEDDFMIISLVRSRELGFLRQIRRSNVMLTRFKKGMFIVSNKKFVQGVAAETLVGQLAGYLGETAWLDLKDLDKVEILKK